MNEQHLVLESQVREVYGRVIYTHKTHEKCAEILKKRHNILKYFEIILSAVTTTTLLLALLGDGKIAQFVAALFSTILLGLTLYSKDFNLLAIAEQHKQAALDVLEMREQLLSLIVDIHIGNIEITELQEKRNDINRKLITIYRGSPQTISKAYRLAQIALQENEEFTFTDKEIDLFLPKNLRRMVN